MSLSTWIAVIRNGFCVAKSLLPSSHFLVQVVPNGPLPNVKYIEYVIGFTQVCGVLFNVTGGYHDVVSGCEQYFKFKKYLRALDKLSIVHGTDSAEYTILRHGATEQLKAAKKKAFIGVCKFNIGSGFMCLVANTLHLPMPNYPRPVFDALIVVELSLLCILLVMLCGICGAFSKSRKLSNLADRVGVATTPQNAYQVLCASTDVGYENTMEALQLVNKSFTPSYQEEKFSVESIKQDLASLTDILGAEEKKNSKSNSSSSSVNKNTAFASDLSQQAQMTTFSALLDVVFLLLNSIAFYGYLMGVLAYFRSIGTFGASVGGSYLSRLINHALFGLDDDRASFLGFLAGDMAWTVEPTLGLLSPFLLSYLAEIVAGGSKKKQD